jgi:hypothetical protein
MYVFFLCAKKTMEEAMGVAMVTWGWLSHAHAQEKPQFWKRKPSIVKVNMLLLAHLSRGDIPASLQADLRFVLKKSPLFLEEMANIANIPRAPGAPGWLAPTAGCLEFAQCLTQALSIAARKQLGTGGGKVPLQPTSCLELCPRDDVLLCNVATPAPEGWMMCCALHGVATGCMGRCCSGRSSHHELGCIFRKNSSKVSNENKVQ